MTYDELEDWQLPAAPPPGKRLAVRVTRDALRHVRAGHPWIFDQAITSVSHQGAAGDLAVVFDADRAFAAIGLWDPASPIRIKVLHHGKPLPIDDAFFRSRLKDAVERRAALAADPATTGYRVVHGENDRLPGLVVDRYEDVLVVKIYSPAWWPYLRGAVSALLATVTAQAVVTRLSRATGSQLTMIEDGAVAHGRLDDPVVTFLENGLTFEADVVRGQKTGYFLDQRDNRQRVRQLAEGRSVLDVFSHSGGFGVYAAAGGARSVCSIDRSEPALASARRNMALNRSVTGPVPHETVAADAFEELAARARAGERHGLVVIDPPTFAARQRDVAGAVRAYRKLTQLGLGVLEPGGWLVQASCSSRVSQEDFVATVRAGIADAGLDPSKLQVTGHTVDHPIGFPEGAYLKAVFAQVVRAAR